MKSISKPVSVIPVINNSGEPSFSRDQYRLGHILPPSNDLELPGRKIRIPSRGQFLFWVSGADPALLRLITCQQIPMPCTYSRFDLK